MRTYNFISTVLVILLINNMIIMGDYSNPYRWAIITIGVVLLVLQAIDKKLC